MRTGEIRKLIARAVEEERRTGWLAAQLRRMAHANGRQPSDADVATVIDLLQQYVAAVPDVLDEVARAAAQSGAAGTVAPLIKAAEDYFLEPSDLIPDHVGLGGLIDDGYLAIGLMRSISEHVEQTMGRPLLGKGREGLIVMHVVARSILGAQVVGILDQGVAGAMQQVWAQQMMAQLATLPMSSFPLRDEPHPIWGNASTKEIVDVQMGVLGIF